MKLPDEEPSNVADATRQVAISPDASYSCPTGPDLMPMPKSMDPSSVSAGDGLSVAFREHNVGNLGVTSAWTGLVYLSADAQCCAGDLALGAFSGATISAGSYVDMSLNVTIPLATPPGQYFVFAQLDDAGAVSEGDEFNNAKAQASPLTVIPPPPPPPPSGLIVTGVTSSGATLSWTSGDNQSSTTVQHRSAGAGLWNSDATLGVGVPPTYTLSGLQPCTLYDVNLFHTRFGVSSSAYTVNGAFSTPAATGLCPPLNFHVEECVTSMSGGKTYRTYTVAWERGVISSGSWEIGKAETNNPGSAVIVKSGSAFKTGTALGPYLGSNTPSYTLYHWIRHKNTNGQTSDWVALVDNPLRPVQGCWHP
jgi:hypothetical protein